MKRFTPTRRLAAPALILALVLLAAAVPFIAPADSRSQTPAASARAASDLAAVAPSPTRTPDANWMPAATVYLAIPTPTLGPTATPTPKVTPAPYRDTVWNARIYVKNRIGARQYGCIDYIWTRESKWNPRAANRNGAYGIPQAYPGSKMAAFGSNWRYSPLTQVKWGIWYVYDRYGSACGAYTFFTSHGWY